MYLIEKISKKIASRTAAVLNLDVDREEVIAYGALNLLHTSLSAASLLVFGLLTKSFKEVIVISLISALLRQYTGGTHASTPSHCTIISTVIFGALSLVVKYTQFYNSIFTLLLFQFLSISVVFAVVYKYCPVDNPNKRIEKEETRKKLRAKSFCFLFVLLGLTAILWFIYIKRNSSNVLLLIACIHTGMLWQAISLTIVGRSIVMLLENVLYKAKL